MKTNKTQLPIPINNDQLHRTIELPKPVTNDVADIFNKLLGR
jgi:hypothetical protein